MKTFTREEATSYVGLRGFIMEANRTGMSNDWYRVYEPNDLNGAKFIWLDTPRGTYTYQIID